MLLDLSKGHVKYVPNVKFNEWLYVARVSMDSISKSERSYRIRNFIKELLQRRNLYFQNTSALPICFAMPRSLYSLRTRCHGVHTEPSECTLVRAEFKSMLVDDKVCRTALQWFIGNGGWNATRGAAKRCTRGWFSECFQLVRHISERWDKSGMLSEKGHLRWESLPAIGKGDISKCSRGGTTKRQSLERQQLISSAWSSVHVTLFLSHPLFFLAERMYSSVTLNTNSSIFKRFADSSEVVITKCLLLKCSYWTNVVAVASICECHW